MNPFFRRCTLHFNLIPPKGEVILGGRRRMPSVNQCLRLGTLLDNQQLCPKSLNLFLRRILKGIENGYKVFNFYSQFTVRRELR